MSKTKKQLKEAKRLKRKELREQRKEERKLNIKDEETTVRLIQDMFAWMTVADLMENVAMQMEENKDYEPKQKLKELSNNFISDAKKFNKELKKELGVDKTSESFGDTSNFLHELFDIAMFIKGDNRMKLLSTAKLMVK